MAKATKPKGIKQKRVYTEADREKARAVYATTGSYTEAMKAVGATSVNTVKPWILAPEASEKVKQAREDARLKFVAAAWNGIMAHVEHLTNDRAVAATTARDSATIVGILVDKIQLVTGQPTVINEQQGQVTQRYEYDIVQHIVTNPESRAAARDLFRRGISSVGEGLGGGRTA